MLFRNAVRIRNGIKLNAGEIREIYTAELLEHYTLTEERPGRLLFHRKENGGFIQ